MVIRNTAAEPTTATEIRTQDGQSPDTFAPIPTLAMIPARINARLDQMQALQRDIVGLTYAIGLDLHHVKNSKPAEGFVAWCAANITTMGKRQINNYMRLAGVRLEAAPKKTKGKKKKGEKTPPRKIIETHWDIVQRAHQSGKFTKDFPYTIDNALKVIALVVGPTGNTGKNTDKTSDEPKMKKVDVKLSTIKAACEAKGITIENLTELLKQANYELNVEDDITKTEPVTNGTTAKPKGKGK